MKEYQRQKGNKYILPKPVYNMTVWQIRDYHRLKDKAESILESSAPPSDGMPRGTDIGNTVESKAMEREFILDKIKTIDASKLNIPQEYREGVWNNTVHQMPFPKDADRSTYGRYKSRFVYQVAKGLNFY